MVVVVVMMMVVMMMMMLMVMIMVMMMVVMVTMTVVSRCRDMVGDTSGSTEALVKREAAAAGQRLALWLLKEVEVLSRDREGNIDHRALAATEEAPQSPRTNNTE